MNTTQNLVAPAIAGLSLLGNARAQEDSLAQALSAQLPAFAEPLERERLLSGSFAVAHRGEIVYRASWGMADYELEAENGADTRFCVASVSKPITVLAVARLVATGRLDLGAKVETWIEGIPSGDKMTLLQLMQHRAGIPHRVTTHWEQTVPMTAAMIVDRVKQGRLLFEPGTGQRYSTAGYSVVARIIEIVTEKDYDAAMRELIFEPFGMKATSHGSAKELPEGRAQCYSRVPEGFEKAPVMDLSFLVGGGSLYSTAGDLVRFGVGCAERKAMPEGTFEVFERLGWMRSKTLQWNGKTNQFGAFLDVHLADDLVVAFTGNAGVGGGAMLRHAVVKIAAGEEVEPPSLSGRKLDKKTAAPFLGDYQRDDGIRTTVALKSGYLQTGRGGMFLPIGDDRFFSPTYGCDVTFEMSDDGTAKSLIYRPSGLPPIVFRRVGR